MADQEAQSNRDKEVYTLDRGFEWGTPQAATRAGESGPLLLDDIHLIELLQRFDRERIPERVVHANGGGAFGEYECTEDLSDIVESSMFKKGYKCPMAARFSTVGIETGGPDTTRDVRGFSLKFYTDEGNVDWVFNNTPIFFLRDPAKFPQFIHTQKRDPSTHLNHLMDSTMFWDYMSMNEESIHQVMILFGDRGCPYGYRCMNGYSGHSLIVKNSEGELNYIQIHVKTDQGIKFFTEDKANEKAGSAPDFSKKDLYDSIEQGDYPSWTIYFQVMSFEEARNFRYDVNDLTKVWPHDQFPLRKVGKYTLNRNPENYFAEIEQLAFSPAHLSRGVYFSNDPVLQSRTFSYHDTHLYRLGVNYQQLPVNQSKTPVLNFNRDGAMSYFNQGSRPNYNSQLNSLKFGQETDEVHTHLQPENALPIRYESQISEIDFEQPRKLWRNVFDDDARERFISNVVGHMSRCRVKEIIARQISIFRKVDEELADQIAAKMTSYVGSINQV